ncbi:hypothetical protein IWZ01DRAFT_546732 [Phyllosticta capitalensis]
MSDDHPYHLRSPAPSPSSRGSRSNSIETFVAFSHSRSTSGSPSTSSPANAISTQPILADDDLIGRLLLELFVEEDPTQLLAPAKRELSTIEKAVRRVRRDGNGLATRALVSGGYRVFDFEDDGKEKEAKVDSPMGDRSPKPQERKRAGDAVEGRSEEQKNQLPDTSTLGNEATLLASAEATERKQILPTQPVPKTASDIDTGGEEAEQDRQVRIKSEPSVWYEVEYGPGGRRATEDNWLTLGEKRKLERMSLEKMLKQNREHKEKSHALQRATKRQKRRKKARLSKREQTRFAAHNMLTDRSGRILTPGKREHIEYNENTQQRKRASRKNRRSQDAQDIARHELKARVMEGTASNMEAAQYRVEQKQKKRKTRTRKKDVAKKDKGLMVDRMDGVDLEGDSLSRSFVRDVDRLSCGDDQR